MPHGFLIDNLEKTAKRLYASKSGKARSHLIHLAFRQFRLNHGLSLTHQFSKSQIKDLYEVGLKDIDYRTSLRERIIPLVAKEQDRDPPRLTPRLVKKAVEAALEDVKEDEIHAAG